MWGKLLDGVIDKKVIIPTYKILIIKLILYCTSNNLEIIESISKFPINENMLIQHNSSGLFGKSLNTE